MANSGWQTHWHKHPGVRSGDQLTRGERAADRMRGVMGSWPFVFGFFTVMIIWAVVNTLVLQRVLHHHAFDSYPYILLNLFLSMLAGVQAAALLIAAKRADAIASEIAIHTEKRCTGPAVAQGTATVEVSAAELRLNLVHDLGGSIPAEELEEAQRRGNGQFASLGEELGRVA